MEPRLCRLDSFHLSHYGGLSNAFSAASSCGPTYCELWACRWCYWTFVHFALLNIHSRCSELFLISSTKKLIESGWCEIVHYYVVVLCTLSSSITPLISRLNSHAHTTTLTQCRTTT